MIEAMNPMFKWLFAVLLLGATAVGGGAFLMTRTHPVVIKSSAQAWVWVAPDQQEHFVTELCAFARQKGFKCNPSEQPGPSWKMIGVVLVTPKENEITVINATAPDKFDAAITMFHPGEDWQGYWKDFRAYVSARHKWDDDR